MTRKDWLWAVCLIAVVALVYQPAWRGEPIWDDDAYLDSAPATGFAEIWVRPPTTQQYHPLVGSAFWLEYRLWGDALAGYHLVNIFLHAGSALLLFIILRRLEIPGARMAAAVFALHPVEVESVAWMVELKNALSGFLFFAAIAIYLRFDQTRNRLSYAAVIFLFLLGLAAKTIVAVFPVAILIIFWWKRGRIDGKRDGWPLVPFFAIGAAAGAITGWMERSFVGAQGREFELSILERVIIAGRAFWFYLGKLFWPADLCLIYPRWDVNIFNWWQWLFPAAAMFLFLAAWSLRRRSRAPLAALLWFVAALFPLLGFFNVYYFVFAFVADHFQYLSSAGIITLVCASAAALTRRATGVIRKLAVSLAVVLLVGLAALSHARSRLYRDSETIFGDVLRRNPESSTAHNNIATGLMRRGALEQAIAHFRKAIELKSDFPLANYNLATALVSHGEFDEAVARLRVVLQEIRDSPNVYFTLGDALAHRGERNEAMANYRRALALDPTFADAHTNLANLLLEAGELSNAMEHYRNALRLQPKNPGAHYNLAVGLVRQGEPDAAIPELRAALEIDPQYPDAQPLLQDLLNQKTP